MVRVLSKEIRVPFSIGPHGGIDYTTDPIIQAIQHIMSAVATNPGERVMRPEYGAPVWDALFGADDVATATALTDDMRRSVVLAEAGISIINIVVDSQPGSGLLLFRISFRLTGFDEIHEASIEVGGTVTEQTYAR